MILIICLKQREKRLLYSKNNKIDLNQSVLNFILNSKNILPGFREAFNKIMKLIFSKIQEQSGESSYITVLNKIVSLLLMNYSFFDFRDSFILSNTRVITDHIFTFLSESYFEREKFLFASPHQIITNYDTVS